MGATVESEPILPQRVDTISLGQETISVRRGGNRCEQVSVDDLILEGLIQRALVKQDYKSVEELYARLDAEEDSLLVKALRPPTRRQAVKVKAAIAEIALQLLANRTRLLELGVARMEGAKLKIDPGY